MIKVLIISGDPANVCNFYRTTGPLLARPDLYKVTFARKELTWVDLADIDIVCVPRPQTNTDLRLIEMVKAARIPLWVDYDDNFAAIPSSHPLFVEFMEAGAAETMVAALGLADLVTVSTLELAVQLDKIAFKDGDRGCQVVRNALHPKWPERSHAANNSDLLLWRGSSSHHPDVSAVAADLIAAVPPTWRIQLMGWYAHPIAEAAIERGIEDVMYTKELPINLYFRELDAAKPGVCVVPLADNSFNRGKSNLAWLEATAAGALVVAPAWPEWVQPGVYNYGASTTLGEELAKACAEVGSATAAERFQLSREAAIKQSEEAYVERDYLLSQLVSGTFP